MTYNEKTAQEIAKTHSLAQSTVDFWRTQDYIPDFYKKVSKFTVLGYSAGEALALINWTQGELHAAIVKKLKRQLNGQPVGVTQQQVSHWVLGNNKPGIVYLTIITQILEHELSAREIPWNPANRQSQPA